jgi:alkanesulfonate monooxygenase SsuD/methylene tetrahydromethanopterin reductase-like flavin-dependent oxidoreductase (luciferase family)
MTLLAAMAEATTRLRIGLMVTGNSYRHRGVLTKMATTIDHLSGGRLEFALGTGAAKVEHATIGVPFYPAGERVRRLGETLTACHKLWTEEPANFEGRYYTLTGAVANPKPLQQPHPPIWVSGVGEKLILRVVAQHADVWNVCGTWSASRKRRAGRPSSIVTARISAATHRRSNARCSRSSTLLTRPRWSTNCTPTSTRASPRTSSICALGATGCERQRSPRSESSTRSVANGGKGWTTP